MERSMDEYNSQIWDLEEELGIEHYLQTKEQFIKQHSDKSIDELREKILALEKKSVENEVGVWKQVIHEHFESCKREFKIEPADTIYDNFEFWLSKYSRLIPTAWRDGIIDEDDICFLLEKSGDYFAGYDVEINLKEAWSPFDAVLEKVN
jgi:hypothetical protein